MPRKKTNKTTQEKGAKQAACTLVLYIEQKAQHE